MALDPLSKLLNNNNMGYNLSQGRRKDPTKTINHLLFMDDLKVYTSSDDELKRVLEQVHDFSTDINMAFGLDKCAKCTIERGNKTASVNILLDEANVIKDLEADTTYKYLGVEEDDNIQHKKMWENVGKEYLRRLKKICRTQLTPKNKISAINQLAIPIMTYSIGIIDWPQRDIDKLDTKTRKILTLHKMTYRNQCLDRIYLPRIKGGMELT